MSLKVFHMFFIGLSIILAFGFGIWILEQAPRTNLYLGLGIFSWVAGAALMLYGFRFYQKFKTLPLVILVVLGFFLLHGPVEACSTCFSNLAGENNAQTQGLKQGIYFLIGLTGLMLSSFGGFFFYLRQTARRVAKP